MTCEKCGCELYGEFEELSGVCGGCAEPDTLRDYDPRDLDKDFQDSLPKQNELGGQNIIRKGLVTGNVTKVKS